MHSAASLSHRFRAILTHRQRLSVAAAAIGMLAVGLLVGGDYGVSIDEPGHVQYGQETLQIYLGLRAPEQTAVDPSQHGPFYSLVAYLVGSGIARLRPGWSLADGVHFADFLAFAMATAFLWILARRYFTPPTAWVIAGAFFTQPVLFGHAFINPKDIPFLGFTLAGLTLGLMALPRPATDPAGSDRRAIGWALEGGRRRALFLGTVLAAALSAALLFWNGWLPAAQNLLAAAYRGEAPPVVVAVFQALTRSAGGGALQAYQAKLAAWFDVLRFGAAAGLVFAALLAWGAALRGLGRDGAWRRRELMLVASAGLAIGLATAIRAAAPLVLVPIVVLYILEIRRRALLAALVLITAAAAACIAAWPYLWHNPLRHYLDSLAVLSHFPWTGDILFGGRLFDQGQQPWFYVPYLIGLQISLPILGLAALGLAAAGFGGASRQTRVELAVVCATLALPVLASLRPGTVVYNNFRQFLFTLPGLFLLAGLGLEALFQRLARPVWRIIAAGLILTPGIVGLVRLHPYEYIYYNALAGGGPGVYTRYASDYWCTSYREAMGWVNAHAPADAVVAVGNAGFIDQVTPFARPDLTVVRLGSEPGTSQASLAIVCDGLSGTLDLLPDAPVLTTVSRAGAVLAQVKDLSRSR